MRYNLGSTAHMSAGIGHGKRIRVLVVDDHPMVRQGLCQALGMAPDIEVVAEASDGEEAMRQVRLHSPDVIMMDIRMPVINGIEAASQLQKEGFLGKVILLSMYEEYAPLAIEAGASGYLSKTAKLTDVVSAIRRVYEGELVFGAVS